MLIGSEGHLRCVRSMVDPPRGYRKRYSHFTQLFFYEYYLYSFTFFLLDRRWNSAYVTFFGSEDLRPFILFPSFAYIRLGSKPYLLKTIARSNIFILGSIQRSSHHIYPYRKRITLRIISNLVRDG